MMTSKIRINHATTTLCEMQLYLEGELVGTLVMRNSQVPLFIKRLDPLEITVDRENITADLTRRLRGFKNVFLI